MRRLSTRVLRHYFRWLPQVSLEAVFYSFRCSSSCNPLEMKEKYEVRGLQKVERKLWLKVESPALFVLLTQKISTSPQLWCIISHDLALALAKRETYCFVLAYSIDKNLQPTQIHTTYYSALHMILQLCYVPSHTFLINRHF